MLTSMVRCGQLKLYRVIIWTGFPGGAGFLRTVPREWRPGAPGNPLVVADFHTAICQPRTRLTPSVSEGFWDRQSLRASVGREIFCGPACGE
jgi:hypothetical protein